MSQNTPTYNSLTAALHSMIYKKEAMAYFTVNEYTYDVDRSNHPLHPEAPTVRTARSPISFGTIYTSR